jgi:hypothetical protein
MSLIDDHNTFALWRGESPFTDQDGGGYPDHVELGIVVSPDLDDPFVWSGVLNLVARIAFEVIAFQPPMAGTTSYMLQGTTLSGSKPTQSILTTDPSFPRLWQKQGSGVAGFLK